MQSSSSQKWIDAMNDGMKSMQDNDDSKDNIERYKTRLVAKGFIQKEGIDYKETFSLVSLKDSFRIIMTLVTHFDLELHQMDVKIAFLNSDIDEMIYMVQPEKFVSNDFKEIHLWPQTSFPSMVSQIPSSHYLNVVYDCYYMLMMLLDSSDTSLLHETKRFLTKNFEMKDPGETSFVFGIQILRDCSQGILRLSQENNISKILDRFNMKDSKLGDTLIAKGDKFMRSLVYLQVCTRPDIAFVVGVLSSYLSDPGMQHWKIVKCVMHYLKRTKGYMLTYWKSEGLEIIGYSNSDFVGCKIVNTMFGYIYMFARGAIIWMFVKQTLIVPSTMAVDLRVVDDIERPVKIYCDNNLAVLYSNNNRSSTKLKFIDIKFLVVKERVQNKQIFIEHIGTSFLLADPLTK
ncbi:hypothetical protein CR513_07575, partial [Mucuna pruriens]